MKTRYTQLIHFRLSLVGRAQWKQCKQYKCNLTYNNPMKKTEHLNHQDWVYYRLYHGYCKGPF